MNKENVPSSKKKVEPDSLLLKGIKGPCEGTVYSKPALILTVGRTRTSKIHIKDETVSEKHAQIVWDGEAWAIQELGSSNGTEVNGKALTDEDEPLILKDSDVIQFGLHSILEVQISPAQNEDTSMEEYFEAQLKIDEQRVMSRGEKHANMLHNEFRKEKKRLVP